MNLQQTRTLWEKTMTVAYALGCLLLVGSSLGLLCTRFLRRGGSEWKRRNPDGPGFDGFESYN